jgi:hypothetical protein
LLIGVPPGEAPTVNSRFAEKFEPAESSTTAPTLDGRPMDVAEIHGELPSPKMSIASQIVCVDVAFVVGLD